MVEHHKHDLIYNLDTKRFRFKDDDIGILYYKQEKDTRDNINFRQLQKIMNKVLKSIKNSTVSYYDFTLNNNYYHIEFERI